MMRVIIHDIGRKQIDFGVLTNPTDYPADCVFLTQPPRAAGDYCLYDPYKFLTKEEQIRLLYQLSLEMQQSKNSS